MKTEKHDDLFFKEVNLPEDSFFYLDKGYVDYSQYEMRFSYSRNA
jgi:hypothetical protein